MDKVEILFHRIEAAMVTAAVQLESGDYAVLGDVLQEFSEFAEQMDRCSRQELKPHMERLTIVQEGLSLLLEEMEHHKGLLKEDLDALKNASNAAKAYAKSGSFPRSLKDS